ncbi:erythromycin biosynthesis sensory transduction protein eryC1 [Sinomonas atrocyanea]|uniref:Erythromycin biosynthesis sensory transduction protein eryC1 n=1 Tax=Sinomonas atrocyanea TaxID=37927 RepID=A0A126ZYC1_9MICC|nr:DegT/DnrJ/EryC1/StrS family aminotransferase [Sinomonas atrocyanea]AMM32159.1 erythromycin biosynthesis sensory transduction protein eryC1 [Sinomonas atrocyanea]GEB64759.1 aminotransferase [Sinomonas atrocyanea]GGG66995.1 aminotransferase [Sinomonas atrocyanea]
MTAGARAGAPAVPFVDLAAQQQEIAADVVPEVLEVLATGAFIGGPHVAAFEEEYARFAGTRECVGVANGTDALELALRAVGVGPGGEVILPANTFVATAEAVVRAGARPVLVDVDPETLLIDADSVGRAVGPRTQAIVPVHLFGQVAPVEELLPIAVACGAAVVEDAAQSQGARRFGRPAGSLGDIAATSFYPGKNLGAAGDAGAVTTHDGLLADRVRLLAAHGSRVKYVHEAVGCNSRLDAVQAVVLRAKLRRLEGWNARRRVAAERYSSLLEGVAGVRVPRSLPGNEDVWHLYVVRVLDGRRARVQAALAEAGIATGIHYPTPVHLTEAFSSLGYGPGDFPVAEAAAEQILSLPMFPHLTDGQVERVAEAVAQAVAGC